MSLDTVLRIGSGYNSTSLEKPRDWRRDLMRSNNSNALVRRDSSDLRVPSPFGPAGLFDDPFSLLSASPFQLMRRMQQDMDRLFTQAFSSAGMGSGDL